MQRDLSAFLPAQKSGMAHRYKNYSPQWEFLLREEAMVRNEKESGRLPADWEFMDQAERSVWYSATRQRILDRVLAGAEREHLSWSDSVDSLRKTIVDNDRYYGDESDFPPQVNDDYWNRYRPDRMWLLHREEEKLAAIAEELALTRLRVARLRSAPYKPSKRKKSV